MINQNATKVMEMLDMIRKEKKWVARVTTWFSCV